MKIKSIEINGLWKLYNLKWDIFPDVNILTGANGSGKSTFVDTVNSLLKNDVLDNDKTISAIVEFDNNSTYGAFHYDDTIDELEQKAKEEKSSLYKNLWLSVKKDIRESKKPIGKDVRIAANLRISKHNGKNISPDAFRSKLNIDIIRTFDIALPSSLLTSKLDSYKDEGVRTELDLELHELLTRYAYYLSELATTVEHYLTNQRNNVVDFDYVDGLYRQKHIFENIIKNAFSTTEKRMVIENGHLGFRSMLNDAYISVYQLSAGEKQLLHILLTVLLEEEKEYILLMDEPEISLHIDWQENLINYIQELNPNCQIIIVTHSPSLIISGWQSCVKNIEDIKQRI